MPTQYTLSFAVDRVDIFRQRSQTGDTDKDMLVLNVTTTSLSNKLYTPGSLIGSFLTSGDAVQSGSGPDNPLVPVQLSAVVTETDIISIKPTIWNFSANGDTERALSEALKVVAAVGALMSCGVELWEIAQAQGLLDGVPAPSLAVKLAGKVTAFVAAGLAAIGELISGVFASPNCDGWVVNLDPLLLGAHNLPLAGSKVGDHFTYQIRDDQQGSPSDCGAQPDTQVTVICVVDKVEPEFGGGDPKPATGFRAVQGVIGPLSDWDGIWTDASTIEGSRIQVQLGRPTATRLEGRVPVGDLFASPAEPAPASVTQIAAAPHPSRVLEPASETLLDPGVLGTVFGASGGEVRVDPGVVGTGDGQGGEVPVDPGVVGTGETSIVSAADGAAAFSAQVRATADCEALFGGARGGENLNRTTLVTDPTVATAALAAEERLDGPNGDIAVSQSVSNVVHLPMQTWPFTSNLFPSMVQRIGPGVAGSGSDQVILGIRESRGAAATGQVQSVVDVSALADAIACPGGVMLQLQLGVDDEGRAVEKRLRYVRMNDSGEVVTDVMLMPGQHTVR